CTGVSEGGHLDRLLVEGGPAVLRSPAAHGGGRQVALTPSALEKPLQQIQATLFQVRVVQRDAGSDHRLGENRIRVVEPWLGPWPVGLGLGSRDGGGVVGKESQGRGITGLDA